MDFGTVPDWDSYVFQIACATVFAKMHEEDFGTSWTLCKSCTKQNLDGLKLIEKRFSLRSSLFVIRTPASSIGHGTFRGTPRKKAIVVGRIKD